MAIGCKVEIRPMMYLALSYDHRLVDGKEAGKVVVSRTVPAAFTASETFDVGVDLGSPVALAYAERRPFKFDGKINSLHVDLK